MPIHGDFLSVRLVIGGDKKITFYGIREDTSLIERNPVQLQKEVTFKSLFKLYICYQKSFTADRLSMAFWYG